MKTLGAVSNRPAVEVHEKPLRALGHLHSQTGQALLEVALMLPFLLLFALGGIEIGRYAYLSILVGNAARAGAAYGAQNGGTSVDSSGICNAASYDFQGTTSYQSTSTACTGATKKSTTMTQSSGPNGNLTVTSSISCGCNNAGTVTVDYTGASSCSAATNPAVQTSISTCIAPTGTGKWVATVSVTASGTFNSLFSYPGIPSSLAVSKTATMLVQ
jgi:Flp pilus assembly protein TadG